MAQRRKSFPQPPSNIDRQLKVYLAAIQEMIETGEGTRGDPLDTKLTFRDLVDSGIAKLKGRIGAGGVSGTDLEPGGVPDLSTPPAPFDLHVVAVFGAVTILWSDPYGAYSTHAYVEIYRASGQNAQFDQAALIGVSNGSMYSDYAIDEGEWYTYWVRYVSTNDAIGPWHDPAGTSVQTVVSVQFMLEELSGQIDESVLASSLNQRINKIEIHENLISINRTAITEERNLRTSGDNQLAQQITTVGARVTNNAAAIQTEQSARVNADSALAESIQTVQALAQSNNQSIYVNAAAIQTETRARASKDEALAQQITTVQAQYEDGIASVQQTIETQGNKINGLSAQYTLRLDVNGYVSGFGAYNNGNTSDFAVLADRFWIAPPNSTGKVKPFIVQGGSVYMDSAFIRDASIQEGKLGPISFGKIKDASGQPVTTVSGKLKVQNIDVDSLQVTNANISGDLYSTNYSAGSAGWIIRRNGSAEFNDVSIRTTLYANEIIGAVNKTQRVSQSLTRWATPGTWVEIGRITINLNGNIGGYVPFFMLNIQVDSRESQNSLANTKYSGLRARVKIQQNGYSISTFETGCLAEGLAGGLSISGSHYLAMSGEIEFVLSGYAHESHTNFFSVSGMVGGLA